MKIIDDTDDPSPSISDQPELFSDRIFPTQGFPTRFIDQEGAGLFGGEIGGEVASPSDFHAVEVDEFAIDIHRVERQVLIFRSPRPVGIQPGPDIVQQLG